MAQVCFSVSDSTPMMPFRFVSRIARARHAEATRSAPHSRSEVVPPSLRQAPDSLSQRLWFWLMAPAPMQASPPLNRLPPVRQEFLDSLADMPCVAETATVSDRIHRARSLRDLWHLRAEVYRLIALHHNQQEAEARLTSLNRHFPRRTPRQGSAGATL
jgi:hypothetical protein